MKNNPRQLINLAEYQEPLSKALTEKLEILFANPDKNTWASIRELLTSETEKAVKVLSEHISGLDLNPAKSNRIVADLRDYARNVVETKARKEADQEKVLKPMKVRFAAKLNDALVRKKDLKKITKDACIECLRLLSIMAVIRLDEKPEIIEGKFFSFCKEKMDKFENKFSDFCKERLDKVEKKLFSKKKQDEIHNILVSTLVDEKMPSKTLASSTWPKVSPSNTLIKPAKCKSLWKQFQAEILPRIQAFVAAESASKQAQKNLLVTAAGVGVSATKAAIVLSFLIGCHRSLLLIV